MGPRKRWEVPREADQLPTGLTLGATHLQLGWIFDPLAAAIMLVMVTFVGLLIFIYSTAYMAHDENFTRFFCFLSLFAGAMLGVIIANSILLLFMCWEIVGLTSYLLIGFWYHKPSAAAAAKKAFLTTQDRRYFLSPGHCLALCADGHAALLQPRRRCDGASGIGRAAKPAGGVGAYRCGRDWATDLCWRGGQERSASTPCLAARRHGRSDAGLRIDPCGHDDALQACTWLRACIR